MSLANMSLVIIVHIVTTEKLHIGYVWLYQLHFHLCIIYDLWQMQNKVSSLSVENRKRILTNLTWI